MIKIKARLYCPDIILADNVCFSLHDKQEHYVRHVMRAKTDDYLGVFNGIAGEYLCQIVDMNKKNIILKALHRVRTHLPPSSLCLIFALIKKTPLEFLVQKATELGVGILQPIITERTVIRDINHERLDAIAIEAAEQCGLTAIPKILPVKPLYDSVSDYQTILFCNERGQGHPIKNMMHHDTKIDAILIGCEGGFTDKEANFLDAQSNIVSVSLGKRIMRAETAALASVAIIQAIQD